jgi:hypothetical protein
MGDKVVGMKENVRKYLATHNGLGFIIDYSDQMNAEGTNLLFNLLSE